MKTDEKQIAALLHQPSEGLQVELKTWLDPRNDESVAKLVKAIFAIRNRNGGFLVIGFDDATHLPDSDLVAWIIPKDVLSLVFSTLGVV